MTHRQKKQYNRGVHDCGRGVEHKEGRGKYYDIGYADGYAADQIDEGAYAYICGSIFE